MAVKTVTPDLVGQIPLINISKSLFSEEPSLIGQGENLLNFKCSCLLKTGLDQLRPQSLVLEGLGNGQRPDLSQVLPADLQGADAKDLSCLVGDHNKVTEMVVEGTDGTTEQQSLCRKMIEQGVDFFYIIHAGVSYHRLYWCHRFVSVQLCLSVIFVLSGQEGQGGYLFSE